MINKVLRHGKHHACVVDLDLSPENSHVSYQNTYEQRCSNLAI